MYVKLHLKWNGAWDCAAEDIFRERFRVDWYIRNSVYFRSMFTFCDFWITVCPLSFVNLPSLPNVVSCSVPKYCTAVDCCLDVEQIGLSLRAYIDINMCTYIISGGIENQTFSFSLLNYEWGKEYWNIRLLHSSSENNENQVCF